MNITNILKTIKDYDDFDTKIKRDCVIDDIPINIKLLKRLFTEVWCEVGSYDDTKEIIQLYQSFGLEAVNRFIKERLSR